jgi:uncharacterized phage infection (PIP) family protein YhgE
MPVRGVIAVAVALIALAITAAVAEATTDRAEYAGQVNPICASANRQIKQLYETFEQAVDRINSKLNSARGKKRTRLANQIDKLFFRLPDQTLAVSYAELAQLRLIAPAAGDETLVSDWLSNRQLLLDLSAQYNQLEKQSEKLFNRTSHSFRGFRKLQRRQHQLDQRANQLYQQFEPLGEKDVELGTQLGATYCVTGATGTG